MKIFAIETSCDETAVAIVEDGQHVRANLVSSQIKWHKKYGGVVPELASRKHTEAIHHLMQQALIDAGMTYDDIDAVAVTYGPGLEGALLIGLSAAKTLAKLIKKPLIGVNHLHGHLYANYLLDPAPSFPYVCLIVSGGHTLLIHAKSHFEFDLLGSTRDDAAGEAFDKVARYLNLGYPGGPIVEKLSHDANPAAFSFPRAMINDGLEFSFSGLKTAVIQQIMAIRSSDQTVPTEDVCASFQAAVIDILVTKSIRACKQLGVTQLSVSGGVSANQTLQRAFRDTCQKNGISLFVPPPKYCTDNAAMIGVAAYHQATQFPSIDSVGFRLGVQSNLSVCAPLPV